MADLEWNLQKEVYRLLAALVPAVTVYDAVPDSAQASFPYSNFGELTDEEWDTDDSVGREIRLEIHTWSRYNGFKELKQLMDRIKAALHRQEASFVVGGETIVLCELEYSGMVVDPDGRTRHGVQRFRFLTEGS